MKTKKQLEEENRILKREIKINQGIQIIWTLILFLVLLFVLGKLLSNKYNPIESFNEIEIKEIECVSQNSKLFVKEGCSACESQKQILGDYLDEFNIIECSENIEKCLEIKRIPTWEINNKYYVGIKTLDELKELTDCYQEGGAEIILSNGETISKQRIIEDCSNLSLKKTAKCLRDNVKEFFIYNKTEDSLNLTFTELVNRGGDCRDFSFLYKDLSEELGFESKTIPIRKHRFALITKDGDFCIINQLHVECFM